MRGIYFESWRPSKTPQTYADRETFLARIAAEAMVARPTEASLAVAAASAVLRSQVSEGEIDDVLAILPHEIRVLLTEDR